MRTGVYSAGPKGGQKGHMPPRSDHKAYLAPRKKVNFGAHDPKSVMQKKMVPVRVAHSNPVPTRLQSVKMVGH